MKSFMRQKRSLQRQIFRSSHTFIEKSYTTPTGIMSQKVGVCVCGARKVGDRVQRREGIGGGVWGGGGGRPGGGGGAEEEGQGTTNMGLHASGKCSAFLL